MVNAKLARGRHFVFLEVEDQVVDKAHDQVDDDPQDQVGSESHDQVSDDR